MQSYKVDISELLKQGDGESVAFNFPLEGKFDEKITFTKNSELVGQITHIGEHLLIDFEVSEYELNEACSRCLTEIKQITSIDRVSESYSLTDAKENSFVLISQDPETHKQTLDITPLMSQELLVSEKDNILCQTDCAGLCEKCGTNRNIKSCTCTATEGNSPFAELKKNPLFKE